MENEKQNKLSIYDILLYAPKGQGIKLYSLAYGYVTFDSVAVRDPEIKYPLRFFDARGQKVAFMKDGRISDCEDAKCQLYPAIDESWYSWWRAILPQCVGSVVYISGDKDVNDGFYCICKENAVYDTYGNMLTIAQKNPVTGEHENVSIFTQRYHSLNVRFANNEETKEYFNKLIVNGKYEYNKKTHTIEKIRFNIFKPGDVIKNKFNIYIVKSVNASNCTYTLYLNCGYTTVRNINDEFVEATNTEKQKFFTILVNNGFLWDGETGKLMNFKKPDDYIDIKFKEGDIIWLKANIKKRFEILVESVNYETLEYNLRKINHRGELWKDNFVIPVSEQDKFELVPEKNIVFDKNKVQYGDIVSDHAGRIYRVVDITDNGNFYHLQVIQESNYSDKLDKCLLVEAKEMFYYQKTVKKYPVSLFTDYTEVLVRNNDDEKWKLDYFSHVDELKYDIKPGIPKIEYIFVCVGGNFKQCIPYKGHEHLKGVQDSKIDKFYINW